jgi:hypothetical protein
MAPPQGAVRLPSLRSPRFGAQQQRDTVALLRGQRRRRVDDPADIGGKLGRREIAGGVLYVRTVRVVALERGQSAMR